MNFHMQLQECKHTYTSIHTCSIITIFTYFTVKEKTNKNRISL